MAEYIEREAMLIGLKRRERLMVGDKTVSIDAIISFIENRPAADVVPVKHGRWILVDTGNGIGVCSNCNRQDIIDHLATHCRFCGAMIEGETTLKNEMEAKEDGK